jgi:chemotaxis response regulator CheB
MENSEVPRLIIVADNPLQRMALADAVAHGGYDVIHSIHPGHLRAEHIESLPSLWLLDVENEDGVLDQLGDVPLMVGISKAPSSANKKAYTIWLKSLTGKLIKILGEAPPLLTEMLDAKGRNAIEAMAAKPVPMLTNTANVDALREKLNKASEHNSANALAKRPIRAARLTREGELPDWQFVCLLAASMGGPEAVKRFLDRVPTSLPVTFVLVQHIDPTMQAVLPRILSRHNEWQFDLVDAQTATINSRSPNMRLHSGHVLLVPAIRQIDFAQDGAVFAHASIQNEPLKYEPWPGKYKPSINDVMRRASRAFGSRLITIVFSGMGDDGCEAVQEVVNAQGSIWAQTANSCVCASQPNEIRSTGTVAFNGSPEVLADYLQQYVAEQLTVS